MVSFPELDREIEAGQAVYSKRGLALYDFVVLRVSNRFIWKCPTTELLSFYNGNVSANHLDIGVGTGFYLDRCRFPGRPRIGLVDLNRNSLQATAARIARYGPEAYRRNALDPLKLEVDGFDSIGVNYLFHCVPGDIEAKAVIVDHAMECLNPGGVIFGATLLSHGVERSALAQRLMRFYNGKGIFHNRGDDLDSLREAMSSRFAEWDVCVRGCAAMFRGRKAV